MSTASDAETNYSDQFSIASPIPAKSETPDPTKELFIKSLSWHDHVYKKLNTGPTPHYIENILGLKVCDNNKEQTMTFSAIKHNNASYKVDLNEPLNLSIKCNSVTNTNFNNSNSSNNRTRTKTLNKGKCSKL